MGSIPVVVEVGGEPFSEIVDTSSGSLWVGPGMDRHCGTSVETPKESDDQGEHVQPLELRLGSATRGSQRVSIGLSL